jgi:hypothetical protein
MAERATAGKPVRPAPEGEKKRFLTSIKRVKAAAALKDKPAGREFLNWTS